MTSNNGVRARACARHVHSSTNRVLIVLCAGGTFGVAVERARGSSGGSRGRHVRAGALCRAGASVFVSATPAAVAGAISVAVWSGKRAGSAALAGAHTGAPDHQQRRNGRCPHRALRNALRSQALLGGTGEGNGGGGNGGGGGGGGGIG